MEEESSVLCGITLPRSLGIARGQCAENNPTCPKYILSLIYVARIAEDPLPAALATTRSFDSTFKIVRIAATENNSKGILEGFSKGISIPFYLPLDHSHPPV